MDGGDAATPARPGTARQSLTGPCLRQRRRHAPTSQESPAVLTRLRICAGGAHTHRRRAHAAGEGAVAAHEPLTAETAPRHRRLLRRRRDALTRAMRLCVCACLGPGCVRVHARAWAWVTQPNALNGHSSRNAHRPPSASRVPLFPSTRPVQTQAQLSVYSRSSL